MSGPVGEDGFGPAHLPYGVIAPQGDPRPAVRLGDLALDLRACQRAGHLDGSWAEAADLGDLLGLGSSAWADVRGRLQDLLVRDAVPDGALHDLAALPPPPLPFAVADYVDFYSSLHHARNVGRIFRPDDDPLLPNWRHLPIGYHGRAGTVVVSGTDVIRPVGQRTPPAPGDPPPVGPSTQLDLELELAFVTGGPRSELGVPLDAAGALDRIFGVVLLDDWSARDLQAWEYRPLGPFLGKSFATSIGAWVTPWAALDAVRVPPPVQDPPAAANLQVPGDWGLDLTLEVAITPAGTDREHVITRVSAADLYWTMPQQLVHVASGGATVRPGDLFGTGTVSGPEAGTEGSLLELTHGGTRPLDLGGVSRTWLEDGDRVVLRGHGRATDGGRLQLAPVEGTVRPAGSPGAATRGAAASPAGR